MCYCKNMSKADTYILEITDLTKYFGSTRAVDGLSLQVKKGEIYGFLGPNGAGKTTTIRMILDILRPNTGRVKLFGDEKPGSLRARRKIGFLSSDMALDEELTGRQYLQYVEGAYAKPCQAKAAELAERLDAKLDVKIGSYSRGNRQKLLLIAALMHDPELLVLDEPTSGFDPLVQETFIQLIGAFRDGGGTVFMSSHILGEVQQLCDRVGFIRAGKLVGESEVSALQNTARKVVKVKGMHKTKGQLSGLTEVAHDKNTITYTYEGDANLLIRYFADQQFRDIVIEQPDLEETFIDYYQHEDTKV
jgi:ABC-2 type transport system ATP-binding protein